MFEAEVLFLLDLQNVLLLVMSGTNSSGASALLEGIERISFELLPAVVQVLAEFNGRGVLIDDLFL